MSAAVDFIKLLYRPGDRLCFGFQDVNEPKGKGWTQVFATFEEAISDFCQDKLRGANSQNNVYVGMNVYKNNKRSADNVAAIRTLYIEIDENGRENLDKVFASAAGKEIPIPTVVTESSPGKYHVIWRMEDFDSTEAKALLVGLCNKFGGDPASTDVARVLRLPGFKNLKYAERPEVKVIHLASDSRAYGVSEFAAIPRHVQKEELTATSSDNLIEHGKLHKVLTSEAGRMRQDGHEVAGIIAALPIWAAANCAPPINYDQVQQIAESMANYKKGDPRLSALIKSGVDQDSLFLFKHPAVLGSHRDYVVSPVYGQTDGWFPCGAVSIIGGSSGSNKSTWMFDVLNRQDRMEDFGGHKTYGRSYLVLMVDRGEDSHKRTMERMGYGLDDIVVKFLPSTAVGNDALREIKSIVEENEYIPQIVFIEGADMLVEDANKGHFVAPFMSGLQKIAQHYHIAIVLSVGAPKMRIGEGYVAKRDSILGSEKWARMAETVVVMQFVDGDDTDRRRVCFVLLRNGPAEMFKLILSDGKLVKDIHNHEKTQLQPPEIKWFKDQTDWWTCIDLEKGLKYSYMKAWRTVKDALTKQHIVKKTGPKTAHGGADSFRWNASESNPLWREAPVPEPEPEPVDSENCELAFDREGD